jgi:hypothetical protein
MFSAEETHRYREPPERISSNILFSLREKTGFFCSLAARAQLSRGDAIFCNFILTNWLNAGMLSLELKETH